MGEQQVDVFGGGAASTPQPAISDADRFAASTKKILVQPLHDDVTPDELTEAEVANHHTAEPAIANSTFETEATIAKPPISDTPRSAEPAPAPRSQGHNTALVFSLIVVAILGIYASIMLVRSFPL